jgi:hypothetical protein
MEELSVFGSGIFPQLSERLCKLKPSRGFASRWGGCMLSVGWEIKMEFPVYVVSKW